MQLDGDASGGGGAYDFAWAPVAIPGDSSTSQADIHDAGDPDPVLVVDVDGTYVLSLEVKDGRCWSAPDYVVIDVG